MHRNMCVLVGTLDSWTGKLVEGQKVVFFTLLCDKEGCLGYDAIECKACGINAERFEAMAIPGNVLTVLGKISSKESDGIVRTGVLVGQISEGDRFDISDEPDSCRMQRIARQYEFDGEEDEGGEAPIWTESMLAEWDHGNAKERAYLRGKYGTPPQRRGEKK